MIERAPDEIMERVLEFMYYRFGIDNSFFDQFLFYLGPKGKVMIGPSSPIDLALVDTASINIAQVQRTVKPSSNFIQTFGTNIKLNRIELSKTETESFCFGNDLELDETVVENASDGFVAVCYHKLPLGCGLLRTSRLINQLPKMFRMKNLLL